MREAVLDQCNWPIRVLHKRWQFAGQVWRPHASQSRFIFAISSSSIMVVVFDVHFHLVDQRAECLLYRPVVRRLRQVPLPACNTGAPFQFLAMLLFVSGNDPCRLSPRPLS